MTCSPISPELWARERAGLEALALAGVHVLVTYEVHANSVKRIQIPNAGIGLNLHFMTLYEMLRRERAQFVLGGAHT